MQPQQEAWEPKPLLLTIEETARSLRLSRAKVYALIRSASLPVVREGRSVRVSVDTLHAWIKAHEQ